tara:strand:- start:378 stop:8477 length:8100 start_codon:yes stop_codon:yes gene_type:complete
MSTYDERILELVKHYRYNPTLYSEEQVDELQELSNQNNIPFNRKTDDFNLRRTVNHLVDGLFEGFTTLPISKWKGSEPTTTYESIAHSLGHLAGFAPGIMAAPLKLGAKGLSKIGFGEAKKSVTGKVTYKGAAQYVDDAAEISKQANNWSVPMMFGDIGKRKFQQGLEISKLNSLDFLKKGAGARAVLEQAVHLGAASAVSSIWKGPDEMLHSAYSGAIAGGAFGGLGEIKMIGNYLKSTNPKNYRKGEQRVKSAIGAGMLGIPTALQGEPIEMIMYQTLLGGYFGYGSRPAVEAEGGKFIQNLQYSGDKSFIFHPTKHPRYNEYSQGAKEYINKEVTNGAKDYLNRQYEYLGYDKDFVNQSVERIAREAEGLGVNDPLPESRLDRAWRSEAHDFYMSGPGSKKSSEIYVHKKVSDAIADAEQQMDANDPVELQSPRVEKEKTNSQRMREREGDPVEIFAAVMDSTTGNIEIIGGINGKKLGFKGDYEGSVNGEKRFDRPSDKLENTEYITWDGVFIKTPIRNKDGKITNYTYNKFKPLSYKTTKNATTDYKTATEKTVDTKVLWRIESKLHKNGRYVYGGIKDKGVLTIREYHQDADLYTNEQLFRALSERDSTRTYQDIQKSLLDSRQDWKEYYKFDRVDDKKYIMERHDKSWRSNILAEAERNGLYQQKDLRDVYKLMTNGYAKDVVDWNKREQLYNDKSMPLPKDTLGELSTAIFKDIELETYLNDKGEIKRYDSDTDGTIYLLQEDINIMYDKLGLKERWKDSKYKKINPSMIKPVIVVKTPEGTMIVKAAGRGASKPLEAYMKANGLRSVIMKSSAKHTGSIGGLNGEKFNNFNIDKLKSGTYEHTGELNKVTINESDIRVNLGTFENPATALKKQRIARQLASNLNTGQAGSALDVLWKEVFLPNMDGVTEVNNNIKLNLEGKLKKLDIDKLNIDDISMDLIHDIFVNHAGSPIAKKLARQMSNMDKKGELEDIDNFTPEEYQQYVYRNNRILDSADFSQASREAGIYSRDFFENVYKKYMVTRAYSPKYKYSAKGWLAPKDPHLLVGAENIKDGHFMLDIDMGKMNVKYKDKDTTLKEAWNDYIKNGKPKSDRSAFEFLVIRVPSDSISGTRVIRFDGFTTQKGVSITTNAKDNAYLGGADKDSDSAFLYQNMPKKVVEAIRSKQDQWKKDGKWIDGKSEELDGLFGAAGNDRFKTPESKFSPSMRRVVADSAAKGQKGLGFGVVAKDNLIAVADYLKGKGSITFEMTSPVKGTELGTITLELKKDGHDILARLGREIINRSADAANYPRMIDFSEYPNIMLRNAFKIKGVKFGKEMKDITYDDLMNTSLSAIFNSRAKISSSNKSSFPIWQQEITKIKNLDKFPTLSGRVADKLIKVMTDDKGDMKIFNDSKLVERLNDAMREEAASYIKRKQGKEPIYRVLTQLNFSLQAKKYKNYSQMRYLVERDFDQLVAWNSLANKGMDIYDALKTMGYGNKAINELDTKILGKIARRAELIKQRTRQFHPEEEWNLDKENNPLTHSGSSYFDTEVLSFKNRELNNIAKGYQKLHKDKNLITSELLHDYFDLWLLSPFRKAKSTQTGVSKLPWQSQSVGQSAIKYYLNQQDKLYSSIQDRAVGKPSKEQAIFSVENYRKGKYPTAKQEVQETVINKVINKLPEVKRNPNESTADMFRRKALTKDQFDAITEFEKNLERNPLIKDNFKDFYENFTEEHARIRKDLELMDISDIQSINEYMKDMDNRFTPSGTELPSNVWRSSPEYVDLHMRNFENKYFASMQKMVLTKEGFVKRKVRQYTGTLGLLKDYVHKTTTEIDRITSNTVDYNDRRYLHRKLPEKEASAINELVFAAREGFDYKNLPSYKKLVNEKFNINGKEYTLDKLIESVNNSYTKDFKQFGDQYIHAKDSNGKYIDFSQIDAKHKYGKYNEYLMWDKDGKFNEKSFEKRILKDVLKGDKLPVMPLETILRAQFEMQLEILVSNRKGKDRKLSDKQFREKVRASKIKFVPIGRRNVETYVPHTNFARDKKSQKIIDKWIEERVQEAYNEALAKPNGTIKKAKRAAQLKRLGYQIHQDKAQSDDLGFANSSVESVMFDFSKHDLQSLENLMINRRPGSTLERNADMPGWDPTHNAIDSYKNGVITASYKAMSAYQANKTINEFVKTKAFKEHTMDWSLYLRAYYRDSMGLPSVFGKYIQDYVKADPKFKKRGYYLFSDEVVIKQVDKINGWFKKHGRKVPGMKRVPELPPESLRETDKVLYDKMFDAHMAGMSRLVHKMGRAEAKMQLYTILAAPKLYTGNMFGGTINTITRGGLKNFSRSWNNSWLTKNIVKDVNGNYRLKLADGRVVKNTKDLDTYIGEQGIIESFIANELNINAELRSVNSVVKQNLKDFTKELSQKLKLDPNLKDATVLDIARKYKVNKVIEKSGAWFMQSSERTLRKQSFLTHAIRYMEIFGKQGLDLSINDPAVMEAGLRGVEATQYIYHSSFRPAYMRTSLGKVLSRFKLFTFNSVRIRKEMLRKAKYQGFKPGTEDFERFKTDFQINMFVAALASAFAYSLFDTALPPPYDWAQETGEWLLGDKKDRDKAFFGQYPYPIAPLNIVTPPIARIPMSFFGSMINNDWDRFFDYQLYTMFPFGRMIRSVDKIIDEPYGTLEGRAMQQVFGLPLDAARRKVKRANTLAQRKELIDKELSELTNEGE